VIQLIELFVNEQAEEDFCEVIKLPKEKGWKEGRWIISIRNAGELQEKKEKPAGNESRRSLVFPSSTNRAKIK
jgi:hypothetical protein